MILTFDVIFGAQATGKDLKIQVSVSQTTFYANSLQKLGRFASKKLAFLFAKQFIFVALVVIKMSLVNQLSANVNWSISLIR